VSAASCDSHTSNTRQLLFFPPLLIPPRLGRYAGQINESLCKVLAHNICVLVQAIHELGIETMFVQKSSLHKKYPQMANFCATPLKPALHKKSGRLPEIEVPREGTPTCCAQSPLFVQNRLSPACTNKNSGG
jgi:hypothetical protein